MSETYQFCILVALVGLIIVIAILWFGLRLLRAERNEFLQVYSAAIGDFWRASPSTRPVLPRLAIEAHSQRLQRRNEFWISYGQIVIAALIIIIFAIMFMAQFRADRLLLLTGP